MRYLTLGAALACGLACAPAPNTAQAREGDAVSKTPEASPAPEAPSRAAFDAARAQFAQAAEAATGEAADALNIYPQDPGDHWDRKELAALRTGDLRAFQANTARAVALKAFADADGVARLSDALVDGLSAGKAFTDKAEPGLARVLAAAGLGTDAALPYAEIKKRLAFLFHFGKFGRLCPIGTDGEATRLRWQMSFPGKGGNQPRGPRMQRMRDVWLTVRYDAKAATATVSTGDEGC